MKNININFIFCERGPPTPLPLGWKKNFLLEKFLDAAPNNGSHSRGPRDPGQKQEIAKSEFEKEKSPENYGCECRLIVSITCTCDILSNSGLMFITYPSPRLCDVPHLPSGSLNQLQLFFFLSHHKYIVQQRIFV